MHANIDKRAKICDVSHNAGHDHSFLQIVDGVDAFGKRKFLNFRARVAARLFQFGFDVLQGGQSHGRRHIAFQVDA